MTDEEIYKEIKEYFSITELVSKKVFDKYGVRAWKFLSPRLLHTLLIIRKEIGLPITINNWASNGKFQQRGLRSNLGYIFMSKFKKERMYLSGHVLGRAIDFDVEGMTAENVRMRIKGMYKILPYKVRLEKNVNWTHLDLIWEENNPKVYLFNA